MLDIKQIQSYYPPFLQGKDKLKYLLREYMQYHSLQFLSNTKYARDLCFIGGTNLRMVHGISRFSEDLDFDINNMDRSAFVAMTDSLVNYINKTGIKAVVEDREKELKLKAFRRNIVLPGFLQEHRVSAIKEEKFLIKIECQNQGVQYTSKTTLISGCGTLFQFPVPPDDVLCSMKLSALLSRRKGRDFYDAIFLLSKTKPNYGFLKERQNIATGKELKKQLIKTIEETNLSLKAQDFKDLIFEPEENKKILFFREFVEQYDF
ncbi:MAG: nucleotidyl transferase AbiEii/AbiGii toxin family protein [Bacteroidetes bacterium]|nr:nucleotidyl transferase AbiEii/AbiGii toxin family protein [Bacteroidota bacterium]MBU1720133.1 nucleotidyl transferase AbiEii/AbiGii toxin family protein [Bacteroidota bacterium]